MSADSTTSKNELLLPGPILKYIFSKATLSLQLEMIKLTKRFYKQLQAMNGGLSHVDIVHIVRYLALHDQPLSKDKNSIKLCIYHNAFVSFGKPIMVKKELQVWGQANPKGMAQIMANLNLSRVEEIAFTGCAFDFATLEFIAKSPTLKKIYFFKSQLVGQEDALTYILENCQNLKELAISWQEDVTSIKNATEVTRGSKLKQLNLFDMKRYIDPENMAKFLLKHVTNGGKVLLRWKMLDRQQYVNELKQFMANSDIDIRIGVTPLFPLIPGAHQP